MKNIILITLLAPLLFANIITNHSIYKEKNSIDLMLTFDKPYLGKIVKKDDQNSTILLLENIKLTQKIEQNVNSDIVQKIDIIPFKKETFIKFQSKKPYEIEASKTVDNYGLRIRVKQKTKIYKNDKKLILKKDDGFQTSFFKMITALIFLTTGLFFIKKWIENKNSTKKSWLFNSKHEKSEKFKIISQKILDTKNRIILLEYKHKNYLILLGENNILLDKFKIKNANQGFDTLLEKDGKKLDKILQQ